MKATRAKKIRHILQSKQTRLHHCHWPGCTEEVTPARWGCLKHWRKLPLRLRDKIWNAYRIGQEETMTPSRKYLTVALEVQRWIRENHDA